MKDGLLDTLTDLFVRLDYRSQTTALWAWGCPSSKQSHPDRHAVIQCWARESPQKYLDDIRAMVADGKYVLVEPKIQLFTVLPYQVQYQILCNMIGGHINIVDYPNRDFAYSFFARRHPELDSLIAQHWAGG